MKLGGSYTSVRASVYTKFDPNWLEVGPMLDLSPKDYFFVLRKGMRVPWRKSHTKYSSYLAHDQALSCGYNCNKTKTSVSETIRKPPLVKA